MNDKQLSFLSWLGAMAGGLVAITAFIFNNFESKADSLSKQERIEQKLDRMEHKIDELQRELIQIRKR